MESGMNQGLESGAFIRKKEKNTFAHLNYCNEVFIDLGRKEGPIETALWNTQQVQLSQEGVGKENKYGIKKIIKKNLKKKQKKMQESVCTGWNFWEALSSQSEWNAVHMNRPYHQQEWPSSYSLEGSIWVFFFLMTFYSRFNSFHLPCLLCR